VQDHRANDDLVGITRKVHTAAPEVPLSGLVNATTMTVPLLEQLKAEGIDVIGYGLDAVTEELFIKTRGKDTGGPTTGIIIGKWSAPQEKFMGL
jgi:biotin synthase-related radical SAM superfamily protein